MRDSLFKLFWKQRRFAVVAFLLTLIGTAIGLAQPLLAGFLVDSISDSVIPWMLVAGLVFLALIGSAVETSANYFQELMGEQAARTLRERLSKTLFTGQYSSVERLDSGDLISTFNADVEAIRDGVAKGYIKLIVAIISGLIAFIMLGIVDLILLVAVCIVLIVAAAVALIFSVRIGTTSGAKQDGFADLGSDLLRLTSALGSIRLVPMPNKETERITAKIDKVFLYGRRYSRLSAGVSPTVELAATGSLLVLLLIGSVRVSSGDIELGTMVTALLYANYLLVPLGNIIEAGVSLSTAQGVLPRIERILNIPLEKPSPSTALSQVEDRGLAIKASNVRLETVDGTPLLDKVDFEVPKGTSLVVTGRSGVGKTSLLRTLCKFQPYSGALKVFGHEVSRTDANALRNQIALVEQNAPLLSGSIREAFALYRGNIDDEEILEALRAVDVLDRLGGPTEALERISGQNGYGLSGGERQRVAVAVALLSKRPLILADEPMSNLDEHSRQLIKKLFLNRTHDQTLVIVSHDPRDVKWADQTLALEGKNGD
ncbi:ABC transporter ATP-binding protein [Corynebacterium cystitidis]|uniref:ABC transporter ATP-binding protein n=1 Tax=Corynebacterium cystitidis TaxID=35757 RepID=UPI00211F1297|nr:ABC transporter ATP-binding protein [Corynebacterium cystitidis]